MIPRNVGPVLASGHAEGIAAARAAVRDAKPGDRSEADRLYAILTTKLEDCWVWFEHIRSTT